MENITPNFQNYKNNFAYSICILSNEVLIFFGLLIITIYIIFYKEKNNTQIILREIEIKRPEIEINKSKENSKRMLNEQNKEATIEDLMRIRGTDEESVVKEINEYYDISDLKGILSILSNLDPWFKLNNFGHDFDALIGTFEIEYISNLKDIMSFMLDYYQNTGINISDANNVSYWENINTSFEGVIYDKKSNKKTLVVKDCSEEIEHLFELSDGLITHNCCRLRLDKRELMKRGGGLFGAAERTGSTGVVTINLPQLGYLYKGDKDGLYKELDRLLVLAKESLVIKRSTIEKLLEGHFYPYSSVYVENYDTFFNTIGINGCNECIRNFTNDEHNIADKWGQAFANELMDYMNRRLSDFQEETGLLFNLEAAPSEGTSYRLALHDKQNYPDIITAGGEDGNPYYTNSTWLPANYTDDIFDALDIQDQFQTKYTGGTVFHAYIGERIQNWKACAELIKNIFTNYRLPYLTISPTFSVCPIHGYLDGEQKFCPKCRDEELAKIDQEINDIEKELEEMEK